MAFYHRFNLFRLFVQEHIFEKRLLWNIKVELTEKCTKKSNK